MENGKSIEIGHGHLITLFLFHYAPFAMAFYFQNMFLIVLPSDF